MASSSSFVSLFLTCLIISTFGLGASQQSAYQLLQKYNLPVGLLPEGVANYDFNTATGEIKAYLNRNCTFDVGPNQISFSPVVTGVISNGRLANLDGVKVHAIFFWVRVWEVVREGDDLIFKFNDGASSATYPVGDFRDSPHC